MIKMFKCIDYVVGEIIESDNKQSLLENINARFIEYNSKLNNHFARCLCVKGVYYIAMM